MQVADRLRAESPLNERRRLDDDVVVNEELVPFDRISQRANGGLMVRFACREQRVERRSVYERRQWRYASSR